MASLAEHSSSSDSGSVARVVAAVRMRPRVLRRRRSAGRLRSSFSPPYATRRTSRMSGIHARSRFRPLR